MGIYFEHIFIGMPEIKPMIIGLWSGKGKPSILNEFLQPFVNDINKVTREGVIINGYRIDVSIRCFLCDSPARSFLKGSYSVCVSTFLCYKTLVFLFVLNLGVVYFNHKYGCQKCIAVGTYDRDVRRTCYAIFNAPVCTVATNSFYV